MAIVVTNQSENKDLVNNFVEVIKQAFEKERQNISDTINNEDFFYFQLWNAKIEPLFDFITDYNGNESIIKYFSDNVALNTFKAFEKLVVSFFPERDIQISYANMLVNVNLGVESENLTDYSDQDLQTEEGEQLEVVESDVDISEKELFLIKSILPAGVELNLTVS